MLYLPGADIGDIQLAPGLLLVGEEAQGGDAMCGGVVGDEEQGLLRRL